MAAPISGALHYSGPGRPGIQLIHFSTCRVLLRQALDCRSNALSSSQGGLHPSPVKRSEMPSWPRLFPAQQLIEPIGMPQCRFSSPFGIERRKQRPTPDATVLTEAPIRKGMGNQHQVLCEPGLFRSSLRAPGIEELPEAAQERRRIHPTAPEFILPLEPQPRRYKDGYPPTSFNDAMGQCDCNTSFAHADLVGDHHTVARQPAT
ncbi:hypothetical protein D9M68_564920 [compost metagenome]